MVHGKAPLHKAANEQVQISVVIVVQETGARGPACGRDARLLGDIDVSLAGLVAIQDGRAVLPGSEIRDEEIDVTVVVVVTRRHTHAVATALDAVFDRHVTECAVEVVAKESVPELGSRFVGLLPIRMRHREPCAVHKEHIHPAVVVDIENGDTRRHRFGEILARRLGVPVLKDKPRGFRGIGKKRRGNRVPEQCEGRAYHCREQRRHQPHVEIIVLLGSAGLAPGGFLADTCFLYLFLPV